VVAKLGSKRHLAREKEWLTRLAKHNHPNILRMIDGPPISVGDSSFWNVILMERASHGDLVNFTTDYTSTKGRFLPEKIVWELLVDFLSGLSFLHQGNFLLDVERETENWTPIFHGDLKPPNLLVNYDRRLKR
jgi:serine/threonine protein kinase